MTGIACIQKTLYRTATASVRHFNRAESLCSHTLHHHDPGAGCSKHRKHDIHLDMSKTLEQKNEPACKSMCSQMFHRHDRCRVFQKAAYLTASISVCHFNRAELLLSDALDHHDLGAVCIEGRPHMYSAVQPATVLANCQLPIPKQLSTSVSSEGNSHHNPFRPGETD